jgi:hypothetical protein
MRCDGLIGQLAHRANLDPWALEAGLGDERDIAEERHVRAPVQVALLRTYGYAQHYVTSRNVVSLID